MRARYFFKKCSIGSIPSWPDERVANDAARNLIETHARKGRVAHFDDCKKIASTPVAVFEAPVVLLLRAPAPVAVLSSPLLLKSAPEPVAGLKLPMVLLLSETNQEQCCTCRS